MIAEQEEAMVDASGRLADKGTNRERRVFAASASQSEAQREEDSCSLATLREVSPVHDDAAFLSDLESSVQVSGVQLSAVHEHKRSKPIGPEKSAKNWGVSIEDAKMTVRVTTQRGMRTALHPALSRRFRTNDRQLQHRRLPVNMHTDWFKSSVESQRGNMGAQIFVTSGHWIRCHPAPREALAHEGLDLLFHRDQRHKRDAKRSEMRSRARKFSRSSHVHDMS